MLSYTALRSCGSALGKKWRRKMAHMGPKLRRPAGNLLTNAGLQLVLGDMVFIPRAAACCNIQHDRLHPINGFGKDCIRGLCGLELSPQRMQGRAKIYGQQTKQTRDPCKSPSPEWIGTSPVSISTRSWISSIRITRSIDTPAGA